VNRGVTAFLGNRFMPPQTNRAALAILFVGMGLPFLGGCRVPRPSVIPIAGTFVGHVKADRYQEAYDMTSPAFRACVTKKQFEEFCRRRNLPREQCEILEPDRRKFPESPDVVAIFDDRILPFFPHVVKGEDGQWRVDAVQLLQMDEKRLRQMEEQSNMAK
jgi:hypothetical protein